MRWLDDVADGDTRVRAAIAEAADFLPDAEVAAVLRHLPGRRLTALATLAGDPIVVKVFGGPRARGNHRRLAALAAAGVGDIVPGSLGHHPAGHVGAITYRPGVVLEQLDDESFVIACGRAGEALRRLHTCGAELDREWTLLDELDQLSRRSTAATQPLVVAVSALAATLPPTPLLPAHRDCHPRQLIATDGRVAWIDLDDCAYAPPLLDVGNMAAHLRREALVGRRSPDVAATARHAFVDAYGVRDDDREALLTWEVLSLTRLAGLAETRHGSLSERDRLVDEVRRLLRLPSNHHSEQTLTYTGAQ